MDRKFRIAVLDEATQATEPEALVAFLCNVESAVLVGVTSQYTAVWTDLDISSTNSRRVNAWKEERAREQGKKKGIKEKVRQAPLLFREAEAFGTYHPSFLRFP